MMNCSIVPAVISTVVFFGLASCSSKPSILQDPPNPISAPQVKGNAKNERSFVSSLPINARFPQLAPGDLNEKQKAVEIPPQMRPMGLRGPLNVLMRAPELASHILPIIDFFGSGKSGLSKGDIELAILMCARFWDSTYVWVVHNYVLLQYPSLIAEDVLSDIREGRPPESLQLDQRALYTFVAELLRTHGVSDGTFSEIRRHYNETQVVSLTTLVAFYSIPSLITNLNQIMFKEQEPLPKIKLALPFLKPVRISSIRPISGERIMAVPPDLLGSDE